SPHTVSTISCATSSPVSSNGMSSHSEGGLCYRITVSHISNPDATSEAQPVVRPHQCVWGDLVSEARNGRTENVGTDPRRVVYLGLILRLKCRVRQPTCRPFGRTFAGRTRLRTTRRTRRAERRTARLHERAAASTRATGRCQCVDEAYISKPSARLMASM